MELAALLVGFFIVGFGLVGLVTPHGLLTLVAPLLSPVGLWVAAVLRVGIGLVLVSAAPASRAPAPLRALGFVVLVAGLVTPFFGVERARGIVAWWTSQGEGVVRLWTSVAVALGAFVVYAVAPRRRAP